MTTAGNPSTCFLSPPDSCNLFSLRSLFSIYCFQHSVCLDRIMGNCTKFENKSDHTCRLVDCDGEVSQWTTDDLKQYCILKDAARISCLDVTLLYRVIACNVPGSYGYSNDILPVAIWVRNDCYAQFKVCFTTGDMKTLSSELNNPWFNVLFDNKNTTSNLYGNITQTDALPYKNFTKLRYSNDFPTIPKPPRQKPWGQYPRRQQSSAEESDGAATENVSTSPETTTQGKPSSETSTVPKKTNTWQRKSTTVKPPHSSSTNPSATSLSPSSTPNDFLHENNLYLSNSGVIRAGADDIGVDVRGTTTHHNVKNTTEDSSEESTPLGSFPLLEADQLLLGAVFGILFLLLVLAGLILYKCRNKVKGCVNGRKEPRDRSGVTVDKDISYISGPSLAQFVGPRYPYVNTTDPDPNHPEHDLPIDNQYFILQPENQANTPRHPWDYSSSTRLDDHDDESHKYFVLENFPANLVFLRDKDDYDNIVPHPCGGEAATQGHQSRDMEDEDQRIVGYSRIGDTNRHNQRHRISQV